MKKLLVALVLAGGIGAIAYASLSDNNSSKQKQAIEKKTEKKEKKECKKSCLFS